MVHGPHHAAIPHFVDLDRDLGDRLRLLVLGVAHRECRRQPGHRARSSGHAFEHALYRVPVEFFGNGDSCRSVARLFRDFQPARVPENHGAIFNQVKIQGDHCEPTNRQRETEAVH